MTRPLTIVGDGHVAGILGYFGRGRAREDQEGEGGRGTEKEEAGEHGRARECGGQKKP